MAVVRLVAEEEDHQEFRFLKFCKMCLLNSGHLDQYCRDMFFHCSSREAFESLLFVKTLLRL